MGEDSKQLRIMIIMIIMMVMMMMDGDYMHCTAVVDRK